MASQESIPRNLDWVEARANCSPHKIFGELQNGLDEDIAAINKTKNLEQKECEFSMSAIGGGTTVVISQNNTYPQQRVKVGISGDVIQAEDAAVNKKWEAAVRLNDAGRCVLWVSGEPMEQWQFRKMVLQRIFFGDE